MGHYVTPGAFWELPIKAAEQTAIECLASSFTNEAEECGSTACTLQDRVSRPPKPEELPQQLLCTNANANLRAKSEAPDNEIQLSKSEL